MASKYDDFWRARAEVLEKAVSEAARGDTPLIDCSEIRSLGERLSWAGSASVVGARVATSSMAHMVSLGRTVASAEMCVPWPEETFFFTMSFGASLRVSTSSAPTRIPRSADRRSVVERPSVTTQAELEEPSLDAGEACRAIHDALADLPRYSSPGEVPFTNGHYFFFEAGENSPHGSSRITRIGNHPQAQDRLIGRLLDHYRTRRDAKNGSVFRRYLGGSLLRRDGRQACLSPAPGQGHWELAKAHECDVCAPYEELVTERLTSSFSFTCVRVDDQVLRNRLERELIASVGQCPACRGSSDWLGLLAYSERVRASGLWNSDHVDGRGIGTADLATFRRLSAPGDTRRDLADTLLLIPCSAGKRGTRQLDIPPSTMTEFLGPAARELLAEGRVAAFARARLDGSSPTLAALARYSGQPYATPGVVDGLLEAMSRGLHVVIVSGGYGLVRAEEPIQDYEATMTKTLTIWRRRIPVILREYVDRNGIRRTFGAFSTVYSAAVPDRLTAEDWRAVPTLDDVGGGPAMVRIPQRVASLTRELLEKNLGASVGWTRTS